ncbi:MAG: hypothetical protein AB8B91_07265 [Rubripirellula sp.]
MPTDTLAPIVPRMQAETGFEESVAPLRVSGFICLLLGLLSVSALLGTSMLLVPITAFLFGFFALRRYAGEAPVGVRAAMIGMVLAAGFGACGLFLPWMKTATLGNQAKQFSKDYLEVVAQGHIEYAMELSKDYVNRYPTNMSLKEHYAKDESAAQALEEFQQTLPYETIRNRGENAEWVLDRPVRIYHRYGDEHAEIVWADPSRKTKIQFYMIYKIDPTGGGQWHVDVCQAYRERIIAPQIL